MKEITKYKCEYCNTEYASKEECERCEASHAKVLEVVEAEYCSCNEGLESLYPTGVTIQMENGMCITYKRTY